MEDMTIDEVLRYFAYGYMTVVAAGKVIEIRKEEKNDGD
jgi:hypothetical protein